MTVLEMPSNIFTGQTSPWTTPLGSPSLLPPAEFAKLPICFAPPYLLPKASEPVCMDHPDIPADWKKLPKKSSNKEHRSNSRYAGSVASSTTSQKSGKEARSPPSSQSHFGNTATAFGTTATAYRAPIQQYGYSWMVHPQEERAPLPERRGSLLRKPKPQSTKSPKENDYITPRLIPTQVSAMQPYNHGTAITTDDVATQATSPPTTSSWLPLRNRKRHEMDMRLKSPVASVPSDPPRLNSPSFEEDGDLALFAAATSGLSPDQPFRTPKVTYARKPSASSSSSYSQHTTSQSTSSDRQPSFSSISQYTRSELVSPIADTPTTIRAYHSLASLPQSAPDSPPSRNASDVFPPCHPLARWATTSTQVSAASIRSGHSDHSVPSMHSEDVTPQSPWSRSVSGTTSKSLDVPRTSVVPPMPSRSFDHPRPLASHPAIITSGPQNPAALVLPPPARPEALILQTHDHVQPPQSSPRSLRIPCSANSMINRPVSRDMTFLDDRSSSCTDTNIPVSSLDENSRSHRNSMISALSGISDNSAFEGVSPIDKEDDPDRGDLPSYGQSQEEMARRKQDENTRRARELQRRWAQSTGRP